MSQPRNYGNLGSLVLPTSYTLVYVVKDPVLYIRPLFSFLNVSSGQRSFTMLAHKGEPRFGAAPTLNPGDILLGDSVTGWYIATPKDYIEYNSTLEATDVIDRDKIIFGQGERIYAKASGDGVVLRISGYENSTMG